MPGSEAYLFYSSMLDLDDLGGRFGRSQDESDLADRVMGGMAYQKIAPVLKALPATTLVFFGDSQTDNRHWSSPAHFPKIVEEVFRRINPSIKVVNAGIGGDDSREGLERIETDVLAHDPAICFVLFGGNDAAFKNDVDGEPTLPPEAFRANIDSMVVRLKGVGCEPVILSHPINLQPPPYMGPESSELLSIMNDDQQVIRVNRGTGWIDLYAAFAVRDRKRMYSVDNDHFSPEAHAMIAEIILNWLVEQN
jgi:lysophospholipase L1-like esterase